MAKQYRTALIIEGDAKGGIRAIQATDEQLTKLNRRFDDSGKRSRQFAKDVDSTSRELEFLKNTASGVGAALAGAFAVSNLAGQAQMIRQVDSLARSLSVNTQTLQQWQYAGQQVGLEADKMGDIFKDVSDKVGDFAATGGGEAADLFKNLNLNIRELQSLSPDQQILKIAEAVNQLEDPSQRTFYFESLADDMVRLQPLLVDNARGLRQAAAEADAIGVAMSEIDTQRAVEAAQAMDQLQGVATGLSNTLIADLGPGLADVTGDLTTLIQQAGGAEEILEDVATVAGTLATVYLARRLGPGLLTVGKNGLSAGSQIAEGMTIALGGAGRLNQALVVTQARIAATSAAARAMNGALALVGGPAGVAILAAGALFTYHEELDAMLAPAQRATLRVNDLTNAINLNSEAAVEGQLVNLTAQMVQLEQQADAARQQLEEINATSNDPGPFRNSMVMGEDADARREAYEALREAEEQLAANGEASDQLRERLQLLREQGVETVSTVSDLGGAASETAEANEDLDNSYQSLLDTLYPLQKSQRDYAEDKATLIRYALEENKTNAWLDESIRRLDDSYRNAGDAAEVYGFTGEQAAAQVGDAFDASSALAVRSLERIDDAGVEMWRGFLDGTGNAMDQFEDIVLDTIAEVAHQLITKPLTMNISAMITGQGSGQGASGGVGSMGGLGDLSSIGQNVYNGIVDGFGSINWMGAPTSYSGGFAGSATSGMNVASNGTSYFGGSTSNFTGVNGLASMGSSYVGSRVGTELGSSLFGKEANSSWGSTIGGAIGTYFGGPIGAFAGSALGGMLDSAFGSSRDYKAGFVNYAETPDRDFGAGGTPYYSSGYYADGDLGRGRESAFGSFGFTKKEKFEPDEMIDFLDAVATLDNIVASGASADQIDNVTEDLDGFYSSVKNDPLGDILEDRFDVIEQSLLDSSSDVGDALINRVGDITAENAETLAPQLAQALQLGNVIDELSGNIRDYAIGVANDTSVEIEQALSDIQTSIAANSLLADAAESLNLQFDALADGAIEAGNRIAELAGGVDPLAALSQQFYDTWMTDEQKLADMRESLTESLASVGIDTLPQTAAGVRELADGIDLMTAAGQEQLVALYQLTPALSQYTSALGETRDAIVQQYQDITGNTPTDNVVSAWAAKVGVAGATLEDVLADIANELNLASASLSQNLIDVGAVDDIDGIVSRYSAAMQAADDLASTRQQQLEDERRALESLAQISDRMALGDQSILDPLERYQEAQRQFAQAQITAETDPTSIDAFDSAKQAYLDATAAAFGQSSSQYAMAYGEVQDAISSLEDQYGESIDSLGSIESIQQQALRAQQRAEDTLLSQLQTQIDTLIGIDNLADLIDFLPEGLASQLASILPEGADLVGQTPDSGGGSSSGEQLTFAQQSEQYLQENPDVQAAIDRGEIVNAYGHYLKYGRFEGREWPSDGSHARGLDSVPWDGYRAELHSGEMVLTRDVADTVRAGMQALETSQSLPPAIIPPAFGSGLQPGGGQEIDELIRAVYRLSDDNARLRTQVDALIAATGAVADNTGAVIAPSERTARASEAAARNSRPRKSRSTA
ncbi:hypothetical protein R5R73_04955 [Salinicola sp. LHM]|uniref:hypothetical protein n=1 Tax=Salinicola sp. LHM TaxID=3065298 RepID=UPI002ACD868E|nr:hypothetical protein [Salinicola sp. LHM]WQH34038.1 hypothetical protein R5R73_04955 [Salinicola sp. LHM]